MADDITKQMQIGSPDWGALPVGTIPQGVKDYLQPKSFMKRGFYPVGTDQGPEPKLLDRRTQAKMMGSVMDPAEQMQLDQPMADPMPAMTPFVFGKRISQMKKGTQRLASMKSISGEAFEQASKNLDSMVKEFPPLARERLGDIEILAGKSEVQKGVGGRYFPRRTPPPGETASKIQLPEFSTRAGYTLPHEGGHHVFETIYELTGEMPQKFSKKFRAMVNDAVSEDIPRRVGFFKHYNIFLDKAKEAQRAGFVTNKQVNELAERFLEGYKRALPHELFANTYHRALQEGLKGEEAVRVSLKAIINNRENMRKLSNSFSMYEKRISGRLDELVSRQKAASKTKPGIYDINAPTTRTQLPQVKGALGRETLEKRFLKRLQTMNPTAKKELEQKMQYMSTQQMQKFLGGK